MTHSARNQPIQLDELSPPELNEFTKELELDELPILELDEHSDELELDGLPLTVNGQE